MTRLALSREDAAARDWLKSWCRHTGLRVEVDQIGNVFMRRAGTNDALPPVMTRYAGSPP